MCTSVLDFLRIRKAVKVLQQGGIIAYPTEAVYGFGCDPFNQDAVEKIREIKGRSSQKSFILIISDWCQVEALIQPVSKDIMQKMMASWPGPVTWVLPAKENAPSWICSENNTIALRFSAHPLANALCKKFARPLVSTSANRSNQAPYRHYTTVCREFDQQIDYIVKGKVGNLTRPTEIRDAITGEVIRKG